MWVFPDIGGKPPKWMVYNGKPYKNGWFGGTPIFGNTNVGFREGTKITGWGVFCLGWFGISTIKIFRRTSLPQWAVKQPHRFHWKQWMLDAFVGGLRGEREKCVNKMVSHPKSYKMYKRSKHRLTNKNCIQRTYLTLNAWRKTVPQRKFSQRNIYQTIWGGIIALDRMMNHPNSNGSGTRIMNHDLLEHVSFLWLSFLCISWQFSKFWPS